MAWLGLHMSKTSHVELSDSASGHKAAKITQVGSGVRNVHTRGGTM